VLHVFATSLTALVIHTISAHFSQQNTHTRISSLEQNKGDPQQTAHWTFFFPSKHSRNYLEETSRKLTLHFHEHILSLKRGITLRNPYFCNMSTKKAICYIEIIASIPPISICYSFLHEWNFDLLALFPNI
jgi:hypothetical protein